MKFALWLACLLLAGSAIAQQEYPWLAVIPITKAATVVEQPLGIPFTVPPSCSAEVRGVAGLPLLAEANLTTATIHGDFKPGDTVLLSCTLAAAKAPCRLCKPVAPPAVDKK